MTRIFVPATPERISAINKNENERTQKEMDQQKAHAKTVKKFKAWRRPSVEEVDSEILHKTKTRR